MNLRISVAECVDAQDLSPPATPSQAPFAFPRRSYRAGTLPQLARPIRGSATISCCPVGNQDKNNIAA